MQNHSEITSNNLCLSPKRAKIDEKLEFGQVHEYFHPEEEHALGLVPERNYIDTKLHKGDQFTKELDVSDFWKALEWLSPFKNP